MLIVGAGAAGMAAAITLARSGRKVTLLEANDAPGKKILVSGNGRCNIGNRRIEPGRYHCSDPDFVPRVLRGFDASRIETFLRSLGLELEEEEEGKLFPMGRKASTVVRLLTRECQRLDVKLVTSCRVTGIEKTEKGFRVESAEGAYTDERLLLAAGSPAAPQLGGSNAVMLLAQRLGHSLIPPRPALAALESDERWPKRAAGVKLPVRLTLLADGKEAAVREGDLLFTDYGVSGLAALDLSREVSLRLAAWEYCELRIDLLPRFSRERLERLLLERIDKKRNLPLPLWLEGLLHPKLVPVILERAKVGIDNEATLHRKAVKKLVYTLKHLTLPIGKVRDFRYAEVATGGIDVAEVDPETLESRSVPGLHFAGEILDVDGDRGGFNFHWAWSTGIRAAIGMMNDG
jgi:predicted Rossmann fold flavoprotein